MKTKGTLLLSGAILAVDQLTKHWLGGVSMLLIPGMLSLSPVRNTGASFGLFIGYTPLLTGVSTALAALLAAHIVLKQPRGMESAGLGLMLGGAVGNLADRMFRGYVVDFIRLDFISFPVFNLADMALTVGALTLAAAWLMPGRRQAS